MKISSSFLSKLMFYFQDMLFCLQCNGRLFQSEKRGENGAYLKSWDRLKHRILIIPEMELNSNLTF